MTDTDAAYLAGLIDGEGCINIYPVYDRGAMHPYYVLRVTVQLTERSGIEHIAMLFRRPIGYKKVGPHMKRPAYLVYWGSGKAKDMLELVLPYLVLKRPQAAAAIEFQRAVGAPRRPGTPLSVEERELREHYYHELRRLKREP